LFLGGENHANRDSDSTEDDDFLEKGDDAYT
jgi:hypothetical protein